MEASDLCLMLESLAERHRVPGVQLSVYHQGRTFDLTHGVERSGEGDRVSTESHFAFGSVAKIFTAALVMQLVEDGDCDLDVPLSGHLRGQIPERHPLAGATPRQLLSHTAGLPSDHEGEQLRSSSMRRYLNSVLREMGTSVDAAAPFGLADGWGAGWGLFHSRETTWWGDGGTLDGGTCNVRLSPDGGSAVALTTNATTGLLLWEDLVTELDRRGLDVGHYRQPSVSPAIVTPADELAGEYANGDLWASPPRPGSPPGSGPAGGSTAPTRAATPTRGSRWPRRSRTLRTPAQVGAPARPPPAGAPAAARTPGTRTATAAGPHRRYGPRRCRRRPAPAGPGSTAPGHRAAPARRPPRGRRPASRSGRWPPSATPGGAPRTGARRCAAPVTARRWWIATAPSPPGRGADGLAASGFRKEPRQRLRRVRRGVRQVRAHDRERREPVARVTTPPPVALCVSQQALDRVDGLDEHRGCPRETDPSHVLGGEADARQLRIPFARHDAGPGHRARRRYARMAPGNTTRWMRTTAARLVSTGPVVGPPMVSPRTASTK